MKILVTGVAGLLGSRMAEWILDNIPDCKVVGIDDLSGGYVDNVDDRVEFVEGDVSGDIDSLFEEHKFDYVYHFAAYAAEGLSPFIRKFNYHSNLVSTANVVNNCINHGVKRLIFTSSIATYGDNTPPFDENLQCNPMDPYGVAKYACELDIKIAGEQHGLDWCILRPPQCLWGKNKIIWDRYRNVLGIWMYQHMNNKPLTIFGDGEQKRAFTHMDDCLEPMWKAAVDNRASKEIINIGGTREHTINETSDVLIKVIGSGEKKYLEERHEVKYAWPTYQKSIDLLDYKDNIDLESGIKEMWDWAKIQTDRGQKKFDEYEVQKGIYDYWK